MYREKMFVKVLKLAQIEMFAVVSRFADEWYATPLYNGGSRQMIEALSPMSAFPNERFPLCVYKVAVHIHPFPQHVKSQKWSTNK